MFLKRLERRKNGKGHTYWALVESYRTAQGSRHRVVAYLWELKKRRLQVEPGGASTLRSHQHQRGPCSPSVIGYHARSHPWNIQSIRLARRSDVDPKNLRHQNQGDPGRVQDPLHPPPPNLPEMELHRPTANCPAAPLNPISKMPSYFCTLS